MTSCFFVYPGSLACRNSYCVPHNVSNSLLPLTVFGGESCLKICYPLEYSTRYEIPQFLMYIIRFERILKSRSENSEKLGKDLSNYDLSSGSRKTLLQAWKPLKIAFFLPTSFSDNHGQKSWDTFAFWGRFPILHIGPAPPLTHKQCWTRVSRSFFRV